MNLKIHRGNKSKNEFEVYLGPEKKCIIALRWIFKLTEEERAQIYKALKLAVEIVNDEQTGKPLNDAAT